MGNLGASIENLSAEDSTIRDADLAEEIAFWASNQILSSAVVSMFR
ncbi:MAG: flagellin [Verrucomicrobiia bacterium]